MNVTHTIDPVYDENSKILILGTMPSPKSREAGFYYGHPQNRFWSVMSELLSCPLPASRAGKRELLLKNGIALWDVLRSCEIRGADDLSIKSPVPNDFGEILGSAPIRAVFTTGKKAGALYEKLCLPSTKIPALSLPSTSPANCRRYTFGALVREYEIILKYL